MRIEDGMVVLANILGDEVKIHTPYPSDNAQDYDLNTKYLTKDCPTCPFNIPPEEAIELVNLGKEMARRKWTPPEESAIKGACVWGVAKKVLVEKLGKQSHCTLINKKTE